MQMRWLDIDNRIAAFSGIGGVNSIFSLVKDVGEMDRYKWFISENRGTLYLLERKGSHEGLGVLLHENLESLFKTVYSQYLNVLNEKDFSPRPNFILANMKSNEAFMSHQDVNLAEETNVLAGYVAMYYLNDDFEGGELYFDKLGLSYKPVAGEMVIFPYNLWHRVKTVENGDRYTAMILVEKYIDKSIASTPDLWP
jgi:hypothetical protein